MFLDISSRPSNIECISQYLSICKSVLVTHPSQPKNNIALFLQKSNDKIRREDFRVKPIANIADESKTLFLPKLN